MAVVMAAVVVAMSCVDSGDVVTHLSLAANSPSALKPIQASDAPRDSGRRPPYRRLPCTVSKT
jgi:hypothetical protein